jgi:hypothetical protein
LGLGRDVANFVLRSSKSADFGARPKSAAPAAPARTAGGYWTTATTRELGGAGALHPLPTFRTTRVWLTLTGLN